MGAGRKTETHTMGEGTQRHVGPNSSVSARNLRKKDLGGVVFGCKNHTMKECLTNLLFGLPATHFSYIKNIEPGLPLFLFNYTDRRMHGIYEAAGHGRMNINPYGWTANGSDPTEFPAQVRVRIRKQCQSLKEEQFQTILHQNYYSENKNLFWFELDHTQTGQLLSLFESSPVTNSPAMFFYNSPRQQSRKGVVPALDKGHKYECVEKSATVETYSEHLRTESGPPTELPRPMRKWVSLFKEDTTSNAGCEDDGKSLATKANWGEDGFNMDSSHPVNTGSWDEDTWPSGVTPSWEHDPGPSDVAPFWQEEGDMLGVVPYSKQDAAPFWQEEAEISGVTPCWEQEAETSSLTHCSKGEKHIAESQSGKESFEDEEDRIFYELKRLALQGESLKSKELIEGDLLQCGTDHLHSDDDCSPTTCSTAEKESSNLEEETEDAFHPCVTDNSHSEDEQSFATPSTSGNYEGVPIPSDIQAVIDQLKQELKEVRAFSMCQDQKITALEKKLCDSGILLERLSNQVKLLEANTRSPSTAEAEACSNQCGIELLPDSFDESRMRGDELIFVMGGYNGASPLPTTDCYLPSRDVLKFVTAMSSARSYASAAILNNLIYNIGGWKCSRGMWCDTVECYKPFSDNWVSCPPLSEKKGCLAAASLKNKIYVAGGGNGIDCFKEVEMFDPAIERWIPTQSMLQKRFASAAMELDGVLYVVGGYDGKNYLKSAERFDPREASWSKLQNMNTCRGSHALTIFKGKLYALGGYDGYKYVPTVEVFDPRKGVWLAGDEMKQPRGYFIASVVGETIYALGGQAEDNNIVDRVEMYTVGKGWSETKLKGIGERCFFSAVQMTV